MLQLVRRMENEIDKIHHVRVRRHDGACLSLPWLRRAELGYFE